jgi:ABC-type antimicrobial peptide transport system permease subunit
MKNKRREKFLLGLMGVLVFLASLPFTSYAVPMTMGYQGHLTDSKGDPVNGNADITFKIYSVSSGGSHVWTETHNSVEVTDGIFSVILTGLTTTMFLPFFFPRCGFHALGVCPPLTLEAYP